MVAKIQEKVFGIVLVDDHPMVREGLRHRIETQPDMCVCGEAADVDEALHVIRETRPDVVIVDIALKESDGMVLLKSIHARRIKVRTLILSMYDEFIYAQRCLHAGAMGYVNKDAHPDVIIKAVREICGGRVYVSEAVAGEILGRTVAEGQPRSSPVDSLTNRQLEVFRLIAEGVSTDGIAKQLHISTHTVETHRDNIKRKLNVRTAAELARYAVLWATEFH